MYDSLISKAQELRRQTFLAFVEQGEAHLGGSFSIIEMLLALYEIILLEEDKFILSKAHASFPLCLLLRDKGFDPKLSTHLERDSANGIHCTTGSLGHGFPISTGMSLARKLKGVPGKVFCLCSDGEWQEGSNWEALIFSRHNDLSNLVLLVDVNGLQGYGRTGEVASMAKLNRYFKAFDMNVVELDGHSPGSLGELLTPHNDDRMVYLLNTIKGKGVSFMENKNLWHYRSPQGEEFEAALRELNNA